MNHNDLCFTSQNSVIIDDDAELLARVYRFILSWSAKTAEAGRVVEAQSASAEDAPNQEAGAVQFYHGGKEEADWCAGGEQQSAGCGDVDESAIDILHPSAASGEESINQTEQ